MMEKKLAQWHRQGRTAVVVLDNPPVNVLTDPLRDELLACMQEIRADEDVKTVVITGAGEKAFMAGANIKGFPQMIGVPGSAYGYAKTIYDLWQMIEDFEKPVICAINGLALGAGMELALVCDLRVADEHARFGFPEIKLGLFPGGGGTQRMVRRSGDALTREMCLTGEMIGAQRAYEAGFLNYVVPRGHCLEKALELAEKMNAFSGEIMALTKRAVNGGIGVSAQQGLACEADLWQRAFMTEDCAEGIDAFLNKRTPDFRN